MMDMCAFENDYKETALVIGGAGFIGSHLVEKLIDERKKVFVLDNLLSGSRGNIPKKSVKFVHGDVRDAELVDNLVTKSDIVFHLAEYIPETRGYGVGHVIRYSVENPLLDFDVSCRGTLIVLEKAKKYKKKVVFTSSAAVYGEPETVPIKEETPALPSSPYGASKICAEVYARLYSQLYEVPTTILRLFNVYGPRQKKYVMHDILFKLTNNSEKLEVLGSGLEERDFIFVQDAVDALLMARDPEFSGKIFNVGTGIATSIRELVRLILGILDIHPEVIFTQSSWEGDIKRLVADISRIRKMGFQPKYQLEKGLRALINWFNNESLAHRNL